MPPVAGLSPSPRSRTLVRRHHFWLKNGGITKVGAAHMKVTLTIHLDTKRTTLTLVAVMSALLAAHLLAMQANFNESLGWKDALGFEYWHVSIFDLDEEESFGTWFSAAILLFAALLLISVAASLRSKADNMHRWWIILGLGFALMSIDEIVGLHELLNTLDEDSVWTVGAFYFVLVSGICFLPFLWHYRWRSSSLFLVAGAIYIAGALGVEHYSGTDLNSLRYNMLTGLEECLEMAGIILVIYTTLDFIHATDTDKSHPHSQ